MALELFDNVRCVDYLLSRPDVDAKSIGMAGISGGGSQTLYAGAVDERITAASPSCAVTTFRSDLADTTMCVCELSHEILTIGDHGLFLAMAYPRPLLVVNATRDEIFPIQGARVAVAQARELYGRGGLADRVQFAEFNAQHTWNDPMIDRQIHWFRSEFGLPDTDTGPLPAGDGPRDPELLRCYPDGDLPAGSLTLTALNRGRMQSPAAPRETPPRPAGVEPLKDQLQHLWSSAPSLPASVEERDLGHDPLYNLDRHQLSWRSGLGGSVAADVTRPAGATPARRSP